VIDGIERALRIHAMGVPVNAGKEPLSRFLARWLEDSVKPRSRPRTYGLYKQQVEAHIVPTLGEIPLEKLTPQLVQQKLIADEDFRRFGSEDSHSHTSGSPLGTHAGGEVAPHSP
jgi:hypothetical protein